MTVVVGVEAPDGVVLAGDRLSVMSDGRADLVGSKTFAPARWLGVGFAGEARAATRVRHRWTPPPAQPPDPERWICTALLDEWGELCGDLSSGEDEGFDALVACGGLLWTVYDGRDAARSPRGYAACGAAAAHAEGALAALTAREWPGGRAEAEAVALEALEIACSHHVMVGEVGPALWVPAT